MRATGSAELVEAVHLEVTPQRAFEWLTELPEHYTEWHPDHLSARWERGNTLEPGTVLHFEELLHGRRHVVRARLQSVVPGREVNFVHLWPMSLISPSGSFRLEPEGSGCRFTHTLSVRWPSLWRRLAPRRVAELSRHLREEGQNLRRLLAPPSRRADLR